MKFFASLLLVGLISLSVTNGQETSCTKWKEDATTSLEKVLGHWFTYLEDKYLVKTNDLCSEYTFTKNEAANSVNLVNEQHKADNSIVTIKGSAYETRFNGVFDVLYDSGLIFSVNAIAMSDDYVLFGGCFRQKGKIWIL